MKAGGDPDAGFDDLIAHLDGIDARLVEQIDATRKTHIAMVTSNEIWGWMFVLPACTLLAVALIAFMAQRP